MAASYCVRHSGQSLRLTLAVCHLPALTSRWDRPGPETSFYSGSQIIRRGRQATSHHVTLEPFAAELPARQTRAAAPAEPPLPRGARTSRWNYVLTPQSER